VIKEEEKGMTEKTQVVKNKKPAPNAEKPYKFKKGQEVKIVFLDGKSVTGIIDQFSRYFFVLELEGKDEIITVFKHAVKYIVSKKPEDVVSE
jgi:sRNA-binding regulator protein Hfq